MGISWSSNRRRNNNYHQNSHPPSQLISSSSSASSSSSYPYPSEPYPAPPTSYPYPTHPPLPPPGPPPPPPVYSSYYYSGGYSTCNYPNPWMGRSNFGPNYGYQTNGWAGMRPPLLLGPPPPPPPPYVEHQQAKKVRSDVNVHKDTLRLEVDEHNPDHHLVSFVFDALYDGSITIFYFAKEEGNCRFTSVFPEAFMPVKIPFQKGPGQKFRQPSGTGIDLGFFALEELSKPPPGDDVFPLVISAETLSPSRSSEEYLGDPPPNTLPHIQITQAVMEKNKDNPFQVRVDRQLLWIDGVRYELREIYGIGNSTATSFNESDSGKECVICMTETKDTAVLPCRHLCMCGECAKALRLQSNKCPICRQPIEELMEIKIRNTDQ